MPEITIEISVYLHKFLDRYFDHRQTIQERFYLALSEGYVIQKGKSFGLSPEMDKQFQEMLDSDRKIKEQYDYENRHDHEYPNPISNPQEDFRRDVENDYFQF